MKERDKAFQKKGVCKIREVGDSLVLAKAVWYGR